MSMEGKICIVTGANSGIGKATAIGLANLSATVVMLCRSKETGEDAKKEIIELTGNNNVDLIYHLKKKFVISWLNSRRSIKIYMCL